MNLKETEKTIESSEEFRTFKKENSDSFLSMIIFVKKENDESLQYCYYVPERKRMAVFDANTSTFLHEDDVLNPEQNQHKLDLNKVHIDLNSAITKSEEEFSKVLTEKPISQRICMLSQGEWSITLITKAMDIFNARIDAETGELKDATSTNAKDFIKQD